MVVFVVTEVAVVDVATVSESHEEAGVSIFTSFSTSCSASESTSSSRRGLA